MDKHEAIQTTVLEDVTWTNKKQSKQVFFLVNVIPWKPVVSQLLFSWALQFVLFCLLATICD